MKRRDLLKLAGGAAAYATLGAPAIAQGVWPQKDKTVKVIVPFPPGAANDALGRLLAERLQARFGCTAVVENRVGGAGLIGTKAVIQAEPDGYTLLASAFNTAVMPKVLKAADFDPEVDLEVVARTAVAPLVCVMAGSHPEKALAEVIASAKADPTKWNFAISSLGSAGHLATIDFLRRTGAKIPMVPLSRHAAGADGHHGGRRESPDRSDLRAPACDPGRRQGTRTRHRGHATIRARAQYSDHGGGRPPRLRVQFLVRSLGAQGHAEGDPGHAQHAGAGHHA
jgi:hypothetical protein